jgi:hypothetical protein
MDHHEFWLELAVIASFPLVRMCRFTGLDRNTAFQCAKVCQSQEYRCRRRNEYPSLAAVSSEREDDSVVVWGMPETERLLVPNS